MKYEEFKRALYGNVLRHRKGEAVKVRLFESQVMYTDVESVREIREIHLACQNVRDGMVEGRGFSPHEILARGETVSEVSERGLAGSAAGDRGGDGAERRSGRQKRFFDPL